MTVRIADQSAEIPIHVSGLTTDYNADFVGDVPLVEPHPSADALSEVSDAHRYG